jgi:hypothetical protein
VAGNLARIGEYQSGWGFRVWQSDPGAGFAAGCAVFLEHFPLRVDSFGRRSSAAAMPRCRDGTMARCRPRSFSDLTIEGEEHSPHRSYKVLCMIV